MELRDNPIQQQLWAHPIRERLEFEHLQASEDYGLRNNVARVIERFHPKPVPLSPASAYSAAIAYNDVLTRLTHYAKGMPMRANVGYLTYEQVAKDLAYLLNFG